MLPPPARAGRRGALGNARARARRGLARATVLLGLVGGPACGGDDAGVESGSDDASAGTTGEGLVPPSFGEPSEILMLLTTRTDDVVIGVGGVEPGRTDLVIDGHSFGPLQGASEGRFEDGSLVLHVRGAMVEGVHRMLLRTSDATGVVESEPVEVRLVAEGDAALVTSPPAASGLAGTRVLALGEGPDAVLVVLELHALGPRLHLVPRGETGWDVEGARTVAAPGLSLAADERVLPVAALRHGSVDGDAGRVRVAYRAGAPGTRIELIDVAWDAAAPEVAPQVSLTVAAALAGRPAEWSELGRPWLMADLLIAELWAPLDVESPRPGDRSLVWSRVHDDGPALDDPQPVRVRTELVDLDLLGPALDRVATEAGAPPIVGIRVDHHQPLVLEHDPTGGLRPRPTALDGTDRTFSFSDLPLATVAGAFGSRTVAGLTTSSSGRMRVAAIDDLGDTGLTSTSLGDDDLPPFDQVTGELAPGSLAGLSVFLVPYGPQLPVHAVHTAGDAVRITPLPELHCDAVALAPTPDGPNELPLACALDGEVWIATLTAMPLP